MLWTILVLVCLSTMVSKLSSISCAANATMTLHLALRCTSSEFCAAASRSILRTNVHESPPINGTLLPSMSSSFRYNFHAKHTSENDGTRDDLWAKCIVRKTYTSKQLFPQKGVLGGLRCPSIFSFDASEHWKWSMYMISKNKITRNILLTIELAGGFCLLQDIS